MIDWKLLHLWVRATWAGWLLGIPLIIALALLGEAVGIGGAQVLVGVGMGTGIGLTQGRFIRNVLHKSVSWIWSCVVGFSAPFLVTDVSNAIGLGLPYSLPVSVAIGGLIAGGWQSFLLRQWLRRSGVWVVASGLGWTLAAGTAAVADFLSRSRSLRGLWGAAAFLGIVAVGGLVLGLVTGICLVWIVRQEPSENKAAG
jgi:hypothetical protein